MRCKQAEYLLSLDLDGRLPQSKRQAMSRHVAGCAPCTTVRTELERAREVVLGLPVQRTGAAFRSGLWRRIESGEGSPDAIFRDPVPLPTKVTYLALGAAAAAVAILAFNLWGGRKPVARSDEAGVPAIAKSDARPTPGQLQPRGREPFSVVALTPDRLADLVTENYSQSVQRLATLTANGGAEKRQWLEELHSEATQAAGYGKTVQWFMERNLVKLPPEDAADLRTVLVASQKAQSYDDPDTILAVLAPIRRLQADRLTSYFCNRCVDDESTFFWEFWRHLEGNAAVRDAMRSRLEVVSEGAADTIVPEARRPRWILRMSAEPRQR
jgi:hypothetical protein